MPELIDVEPGSPEWKAARLKGITATDIVAICGLSSTDSAYALYWRKLGVIPDPIDSDRWRLGRDLEPIIAARWCDARSIPPAHREGARSALYRSDDRPWQMATLDRLFYDEPVELKSWADADRRSWDDGPPPAVRAQVLWQMDVMGVSTGHVGVLFLPSGEFRSHVIEHDESPVAQYPHDTPGQLWPEGCQACNDIVRLRIDGAAFIERLTDGEAPSPDGSAATLAALKARFPDARNDKAAPVDWGVWQAYDYACDQVKEWKAKRTEGEALIREQLGEAGVIEVDGEVVARRLRYPVKAHQRKAGVVDKIMRVKRKDDDDDTN